MAHPLKALLAVSLFFLNPSLIFPSTTHAMTFHTENPSDLFDSLGIDFTLLHDNPRCPLPNVAIDRPYCPPQSVNVYELKG